MLKLSFFQRNKMKNKKSEEVVLRYVTLTYEDVPGRTVMVAGSFNDWQPVKQLTDKNGDGVYRCRLKLAAGEYQYKFVVDGVWCLDSANPNFTPNDIGSLNSVLSVKNK